jgi:hypothetical protein
MSGKGEQTLAETPLPLTGQTPLLLLWTVSLG